MHSLLNNFKFWDFFTANKIRKSIYRILSTTTPDNESSAIHRVALSYSTAKSMDIKTVSLTPILNESIVLTKI